jgi:pimeloyl-ACP methyl ester carboxylesterase
MPGARLSRLPATFSTRPRCATIHAAMCDGLVDPPSSRHVLGHARGRYARRSIFSQWCYNPELYTPEEIAVYVAAYSQPGAIKGACNDYRAAAEDVAQDEEDKDTLIACPTLALWGEEFESGGKMWDFRAIWTKMAERIEFVSIPACGHHPHEEKPEVVNRELLRFLSS